MKKCPYCNLNYINDTAFCCKVCYSLPNIRNIVIKKQRQLLRLKEVIKQTQKKEQDKKRVEQTELIRQLTEAANKKFEKERELQKLEAEKERELFETSLKKEEEKRIQQNKLKTILLDKLTSHGFYGFLHTTNFSNFINIYKSGFLYSRNEMNRRELKFDDNAEPQIIQRTPDTIKNYVRFYYKTKTPTNIRAFQLFGQTTPVILQFDPNIIFDDFVKFTNGCAKSKKSIITSDVSKALQFNWKNIFDRTTKYYTLSKEEKEILINNRNAEFLYLNKISTSKILKIYFRTLKDRQTAISLFGEDKRFIVDSSKFYGG